MVATRRSRTANVLIAICCLLTLVAGDPARGTVHAQRPADTPGRAASPRDAASDPYVAWALGQLIYDVPDDAQGASSALRGHSLARTMYGLNDQVPNTQPFNGTGRLHFRHGPDSGAISGGDDHHLINYQAFGGEPLRDPERYGVRADTHQPRAFFTGGFNGSYTYPDVNNMFLAAARADGTAIAPSFHRGWIFGSLDAGNPNWTSPNGKYLLLRPRPAEMGRGFPFPDLGPALAHQGDVKNLVGAPGGNDSVWIDLGYPVQRAADGRKFKPLFAFFVVDLDNRIDVSVRANVMRGSPRDLEIPSITPWLWDRFRESFYAVPAGHPDSSPAGPAIPFPELSRRGDPSGNPGEPVPAFSDFRTPGLPPDNPEADWRGLRILSLVAQGVGRVTPHSDASEAVTRLAAALGNRVDLNRPLPGYPRKAPFVTPAHLEEAQAAQWGRQELAEEIYRRLLLVAGVAPVPEQAIEDPSDEDLAPRRWLAQLAVNIVDYIDEDDISTPFNFYSPPLDGLPPADVARGMPTRAGEQLPRYWVFGTELPSVVLNEVMTEFVAPPTNPPDPPPDIVSVKVWAELHNPGRPDPSRPPDGSPVHLFAPTSESGQGYSPYLVVIANTGPSGRTPLFDHPDNVTGSSDRLLAIAAFGPKLGTVGNPDSEVPASIGHDSYLIVGPRSEGGQDAQRTIHPTRTRPAATRWLRSEGMEFRAAQNALLAPVTVLLRRLANPHLPPDPRPAVGDGVNPLYNPYITVDYVEGVSLQATPTGTQSIGKLQPFAAHPNRIQGQTAVQGGGTRHTLGEANQPRQLVADWLVHLDRPLTSPAELLSVTGVRPHELTHRFITTPADQPADFAHRAPWFDEDLSTTDPPYSHRLYRVFEVIQSRDRSAPDDAYGARSAINLNSIHELEAFRSLLGSRLEDQVGLDQVVAIWNRLLQLRSPAMLGPNPTVTEADRPFQSPAVGILPASDPQAPGRGINIEDTIFRASDPGALGRGRLFDIAGEDHPYRQKGLLAAIQDRIAVRSNVFAVWLTVGFFEVVDDTSSPVKLGVEVGQAQNREVRHRFFAIVDRTNLQLFGRQDLSGQAEVTRHLTRSHARQGAVPGGGRHWVPLEALSGFTATEARDAAGAPTGQFLSWRIAPGSHLFADTGPRREIVLVTDVDPVRNAIEAVFRRPHAPGFEISMPGNPGPQSDFDPGSPLFHDVISEVIRLE